MAYKNFSSFRIKKRESTALCKPKLEYYWNRSKRYEMADLEGTRTRKIEYT